MTSKISFSKLVWDETRKLGYLLALQCLVLLALIPFRVLLTLAVARTDGYLSARGQTLYDVFCENVGLGRVENTVVILALGIICALAAFSYLHSAMQLDFYHSLAMRREKLFAAKYLGSFLTFAIPYVAAQLLAIPAGMCYGVFSCKVTVEILLSTAQGLLFFLCSYSGTLVAIMLTGKLLTAVLALVVMGFYIPLVALLCTGYQYIFFYTCLSAMGVEVWATEVIKHSSPWVLCVNQYSESVTEHAVMGATGSWPAVSGMVMILAATVILSAAALALYRIRRTEAAGRALAFQPLETAVKLLVAIPVAAAAPVFAYELLDSVVWEAVFAVIAGVLACMIMEFIYRWDIRQILAHKLHIVITVAAALAIFFFCRFDIPGYNTYLPGEDELESMSAFTYAGHLYLDADGFSEGYGSARQLKELMDRFETEDFEDYYRMARDGVERVRNGGEDGDEDVVSVGVKYNLKNGKDVYREYLVGTELFLEVFDGLQKNREFVDTYYPIMIWTQENIAALGDVYFYADDSAMSALRAAGTEAGEEPDNQKEETDYDEEMEYVEDWEYTEIPDDDIERLVEAYRKDLLELSFRDCWLSGASCYLSFEIPARGSGYMYLGDNYYLNEKFVNTWEVLTDIVAGR